MLEINEIQLAFQRPILLTINLTIKQGEIVGIVGKSGAGKTSLLKIIGGLLDSTSGSVLFEGKKVAGPKNKLVPGHPDIQLVNQDFHLDTYHTVEENIREQILYLPKKERDDLVEELLHILELTEIRNQKAITLSGGEQQRLSIARALACEPKVLLLDEPFAHLDGRLRSKLTNYLLNLRKVRNTTLILVSHDGAEVLSLADIIYSMKNGIIARKGKPSDFYYKPKSIEDAKLFGAINSINLNGKRTIFRPDEYALVRNDEVEIPSKVIDVAFSHTLFTGPVCENYFQTANKEKIVLYSFKTLENVRKISIEKKK
jgi:ABC-type Fe3+/spermidine/putrescine transport system ATPase subunit